MSNIHILFHEGIEQSGHQRVHFEDPLTFAIVTGPANGSLSGFNLATGDVTYTPNTNFNGTDSFTFQVSDGLTNSGIATVNLTVTPVNDTPVAMGQAVTLLEDTATNLVLTASDLEGDPLTYVIASGPSNGSLSGFNPFTGAVTYTPDPEFTGGDNFTFHASDGVNNSADAAVTINVLPVNDDPVAVAGGGHGTNQRSLPGSRLLPLALPAVDVVVIDCSFISLRKIPPCAVALLRPAGKIVALIKPQFEAGKADADKGRGVIADPAVHQRVLDELRLFVESLPKLRWLKLTESPLRGPAGNKEFLVLLEKPVEQIRRVGLIANVDKANCRSLVRRAARLIEESGRTVLMDEPTARLTRRTVLACPKRCPQYRLPRGPCDSHRHQWRRHCRRGPAGHTRAEWR